MKNRAKYLSYTKAWSQIKDAIADGFYFEAVTIEESIISDRLLSYLLGTVPDLRFGVHTNLSSLIKKWRKVAGEELIESDGNDLGKAVDDWRKNRNVVVHGLVKSTPRTPTMDVDDFLDVARQTAEEGRVLSRKVQNWHKKMLKESKRTNSTQLKT